MKKKVIKRKKEMKKTTKIMKKQVIIKIILRNQLPRKDNRRNHLEELTKDPARRHERKYKIIFLWTKYNFFMFASLSLDYII